MKTAYIDGSSGVSGDMILGSLVHVGWPIDNLRMVAKSLGLDHVKISCSQVEKNHIYGTQINMEIPHEHEHRGLTEIQNRIMGSGLEPDVCKRAISVFSRLAEAESTIHGMSIEDVHFHEVGAVDAMIDIVGTCKGLYDLRIDNVIVGPLRVGSGYVKCAHGEIPVPGPATSEILKGVPYFAGDTKGEWTTPTGASLIKEWATSFGNMPIMTVQSVGMGAGQANPPFPNLLRIFIGKEENENEKQFETVYMIETEIDDMPGEYYSYINQLLFEVAVNDFYITPVYMKKNRPGQLLTVIVNKEKVNQVIEIIFKETTTFGIRLKETQRICLDREIRSVKICNETIRVKIGLWENNIVQVSPEYEDCRKAAINLCLPVDDIYQMVKNEGKKILVSGGLLAD